MEVTGAEFSRLADPPDPELVLRVVITGTGFEQRAVPILASVGDVQVEGLVPSVDGEGLVGLLAEHPPVGAELVIGYAGREPLSTGITYNPPIS
ncbi:hypothetical protein [Streptomyces sp. NPDC051001]|uniref:hypothetical protein n=1 Tax=Streptomyces sp. NPDC051001 TaxID=3155795 RepID=UPI00342C6958